MASLTFSFLLAVIMYTGVQCQSQSFSQSCSTINGVYTCNSDSNQNGGFSGSSSSSSSSNGGQTFQQTYTGGNGGSGSFSSSSSSSGNFPSGAGFPAPGGLNPFNFVFGGGFPFGRR